MKIAVIDLGTNTLHIVAGQILQGVMKLEYKKRWFLRLGEHGIGHIPQNKIEQLLDYLHTIQTILEDLKVSRIKLVCTEAMRRADNGEELMATMRGIYPSWEITIITGQEEAAYIAKGVKMSLTGVKEQRLLVFDIGGGSCEFIGLDGDSEVFSYSFPIGITALYQQFSRQEPVTKSELDQVQAHLSNITQQMQLSHDLSQYRLVGASGSFEIFELLGIAQKINPVLVQVKTIDFEALSQFLLSKSYVERLSIEALPQQRAQMVVESLMLINFVVKLTGGDSFYCSSYAMKEGVMVELSKN